MTVKMSIENGVLTVLLNGEIDHHSAGAARERIDMQTEKLRPKTLVLDFGGVGFMDSSGIGLIMGRHRLMSELGGALKIANAPNNILRMFKMAGLKRLGIEC